MKTLNINLNKINEDDIEKIATSFARGEVVAYPTDTVYGLGCIANNEKSIKKILRIKNRGPQKGMIILINSYSMLKKYCKVKQKQLDLIKSDWPGPVTFLLKSKGALPKILSGKNDLLAVRMPGSKRPKGSQGVEKSKRLLKHSFLTKIIRRINAPLVSTSLNLSGEKTLANPRKVDTSLKGRPDLLVNAGVLRKNKPSKIIDLSDFEKIRVVRK